MDKFTNYLDEDTKEVYNYYKKFIMDDDKLIHDASFRSEVLNQVKYHDYEGYRCETIIDLDKAFYHHKVAYEFLVLYAMLPNVKDANHYLSLTFYSIAKVTLAKDEMVEFEYYYMEFLSSTLQALLDISKSPYLLDEINFLKDKVEEIFKLAKPNYQQLIDKLKHLTNQIFNEFDEIEETNHKLDLSNING